jgi:Zn-dependent protease with chaperone function
LRISRAANIQSDLYIVEGDDPNAFATFVNGQRVIGINLGMVKLIDGDVNQYAALIGHEAAHWTDGSWIALAISIESSEQRGAHGKSHGADRSEITGTVAYRATV